LRRLVILIQLTWLDNNRQKQNLAKSKSITCYTHLRSCILKSAFHVLYINSPAFPARLVFNDVSNFSSSQAQRFQRAVAFVEDLVGVLLVHDQAHSQATVKGGKHFTWYSNDFLTTGKVKSHDGIDAARLNNWT